MMDIEVPETCWADYKRNKLFSSIYLVFFSTHFFMLYEKIRLKKACKLKHNLLFRIIVKHILSKFNIMIYLIYYGWSGVNSGWNAVGKSPKQDREVCVIEGKRSAVVLVNSFD
jgi:hypothetical protein